MKEIFIELTTGGYETSEIEVSVKDFGEAIKQAVEGGLDVQETDSSTVIIDKNTFTIFVD